MTPKRVLRVATLAMLLIASGSTWTDAQENKGKSAPPAGEGGAGKGGKAARPDRAVVTTEQEDAAAQQGLGAFGKVMPIGEKNIDVKIPSFKDGNPSSTVRAASMTRVDDENMEMENMDIRLFGETHVKDVRIQLSTAQYNMPSQILSSDKRSRVSRDDFRLEGDSMVFDTRTGQGKMVGNVRMQIYDSDSFTATPKKEGPAEAGEKKSDGDKTPAIDKKEEAAPNSAVATPPTTPSSPAPNEKK